MPEIYRLAAADGAAAAIALPMYAGEPQWFLEGDYLLYSTTAEFIPLANGIGRWVPSEYLALGQATHDFPSSETAAALRLYGITHVLFHGARFGADAPVLLERVRHGRDFTIVTRRGSDTLLRVTDARISERSPADRAQRGIRTEVTMNKILAVFPVMSLRNVLCLSVAAAACVIVAAAPAAQGTYYPPAGSWAHKTPAEVGMDAARLDAAIAFAKARETSMPKDFSTQEKIFGTLLGPIPKDRAATNGLVIRRGYVVAEFGDTSHADPTY